MNELDKYKNLFTKLKVWHSKALRMQAKMAEELESLYDKIEDLEEEIKKLKGKEYEVVDNGKD